MTFVMIALLIAFAVATAIVLADSGLRLWFAIGEIAAQRKEAMRGNGELPQLRNRAAAQVSMRISYARTVPVQNVPLRAAA